MKLKVMLAVVVGVGVLATSLATQAQFFRAKDPGVRGGPAGAGDAPGLERRGTGVLRRRPADFEEVEGVATGLGPADEPRQLRRLPRPARVGGTSPAVNPQVAFARRTAAPIGSRVPSLHHAATAGPRSPVQVQSGRHPGRGRAQHRHDHGADGSRPAASGPAKTSPRQFANRNVIFRIPTPLFGAGLIEQIPDSAILANQAANATTKSSSASAAVPIAAGGRHGDTNNNGNDGTIARFGWKAQNQSLLLFSGEAYNVEMGITNELFQQEREREPHLPVRHGPQRRHRHPTVSDHAGRPQRDREVRLLPALPGARPLRRRTRRVASTSISNGKQLVHEHRLRALSHADAEDGQFHGGGAAQPDRQPLLRPSAPCHGAGPGRRYPPGQSARGDEFRTAPLWGLGQRIFFLHDGRTNDLIEAIQAHKSAGNTKFGPSEANAVIDNFNNLREGDKQDLLNFLRSL